jgi:hypothetical protein
MFQDNNIYSTPKSLALRVCNDAHNSSVYMTLHYYNIHSMSEEVRQGLNYALRHALACTINCVLLAITHACKCSWQLKSRLSQYLAGG